MSSQDNLSAAVRAALTRFESTLTADELADMKISSLDDVHEAMRKIQQKQGSERKLRNLNRMKVFLEGMRQYEELVKVFLNVSSVVAFVWGPIKFLLLTASTWADAFDRLLDAYQRLGDQIPQFKAYKSIFGGDARMRELLDWIFIDLLEFHRRALMFFRKRTWQQLFRASWKDFETRIGHILESLEHHKKLVESEATLYEIRAAQTRRATAETQFEELTNQEDKRRRIAVAAWLDGAKSHLDQLETKATREAYPQSGRWLLDRPKMKTWLDFRSRHKPLLWLRGIPGAGKTILASIVIEEAEKLHPQATVLYFYCKYHDAQKRTMTAILRELLLQCLPHDAAVLPYLYAQCAASAEAKLESPAALKELFQTVLRGATQVAIVVDGLDECDEAERKQTLAFLRPLLDDANRDSPGSVRALFTSQDVADMRRHLRQAEVLVLTAQDNAEDIRAYTEYWAARIQARFNLPGDEVRRITEHVTETAKGMFLYAKLVMQNLFNSVNQESLYMEIHPDTLPKGIDQAYDRVVYRVLNREGMPSREEAARRLLGWILCAKRPLLWHEIQGAASIELHDATIAYESRCLRDDAKELCGSLVDVHACGTVVLVHSTARQYLLKRFYKGDVEETKMALLCMGYLTFDCFDADQSDDDIRQNIATAKYAFQDYAVAHWIDHLKASVQNTVGPCSHQELTDLVDDFIAKHWNDAFKPNPRIPKQVKTAFRALEGHDFHEHLLQAYHFGNADAPATESTVEPLELLRIVRRVRLVYEQMVSALPARESAQGRQLRQYYGANWFKCPRPVCRRFYDGFASARERDSHEKRHSRSFRCDVAGCFASASGCASEQSLKKHKAEYHSGVESLFPTYRPKTVAEGTNAVAEDKIALLFKLAREGDVRALKQHLDPACVSVTDAKRDTLMHIAGRLGNVDLAQTLLSVVTSGTGEANAAAKLVNARNKNGASPLSLSLVKNGNEAIVKLLLKHGAIPKSHNRRLLSMADRIGDDEFSGLLRQIATDLPPPFPMEDESVTRVIRFMFNDSYRVDFPVDKTQLLFHAAHSDNEQAATICLEHGANVNGTAVRRPLVATARKGHREMVQLLLEAGADPNASEKGETALGVAMFYGSAGVLRTLLEHSEIAVNLSSSMDGPPICCAAIRGVAQAVQLLLEHPKIEVNAQTASGKTALILAAEEGHLNVIQALLKSHHIDIAAVDKDGLTALDWAKRNKRNKVAAEIEAFLAHSSSAATNKGWVNGRW